MAEFIVLWRVLCMKAGQGKSMRVLGIIGIVAFIGFFIMRYEMFVDIMNNPGNFVDGFLDDPLEFTVLVILYLLTGGPIAGA